jgi:hypothetical protein
MQQNGHEAEIIVRSKDANDVLVIVVDVVSLPSWLADHCRVHDWTLYGESMEHRLWKFCDWLSTTECPSCGQFHKRLFD